MAEELWAVMGDENDHGHGQFKDPGSGRTVYINGKSVICRNDEAYPDDLCAVAGGNHCDPIAEGVSSTVFANNRAAHRNNDTRNCGAKTIVTGQDSVKVG